MSFKEVGIPLKEIKLFLNGKTAGTMINLLKEKSIEIENKIKELQQLITIYTNESRTSRRSYAN